MSFVSQNIFKFTQNAIDAAMKGKKYTYFHIRYIHTFSLFFIHPFLSLNTASRLQPEYVNEIVSESFYIRKNKKKKKCGM